MGRNIIRPNKRSYRLVKKAVAPFLFSPFIFGKLVRKDLIERLPTSNKRLAMKVKHVLELNKVERHIHGGEATRKKYKETKENEEK